MNVDNPYIAPDTEREGDVEIFEIDPKNRSDVHNYYHFEVKHGFSTFDETKTSLDGMVDFRQKQIENGQIKVFSAKQGNELIATSVVVLKNAPDGGKTMGKDIRPDEAFAAGTYVLMNKRGGELAPQLALKQEEVAITASKKSIITDIDRTNPRSMRFRMNKMGYVLESVKDEANLEKDLNHRRIRP